MRFNTDVQHNQISRIRITFVGSYTTSTHTTQVELGESIVPKHHYVVISKIVVNQLYITQYYLRLISIEVAKQRSSSAFLTTSS